MGWYPCCCDQPPPDIESCTDCCTDAEGMPDSLDVAIPDQSFTDDDCNKCDEHDGATYNLEFQSGCAYSYSEGITDWTCPNCPPNANSLFGITAGFGFDAETDECWMEVEVVVAKPLRFLGNCNNSQNFGISALYRSERFPGGECLDRTWECEYVETDGDGNACTFAPDTTITVTAVYD